MKKALLTGIPLLLIVFLAANVLAADRVVVIPLGATKSDPNLVSENICFGVPILGVVGAMNCAPTVVSVNGRIWMDRNLGASQVATSSTDSLAYGDLYQWGRLTDGHQLRTSPTTSDLSDTDAPGHGSFIITGTTDWLASQNDTLWQGVSGTNNPCPSGFRLPTIAEWNAESSIWGPVNPAAAAFASPLKLVVAGNRVPLDGALDREDSYGYYWNSGVSGTSGHYLFFGSISRGLLSTDRARGFSVRCIMD